MTRRPATALLIAVAVLGACGACSPYATVPQTAEPGQHTGQRVGICYNSLRSSPAQLQAEAQHECPPDSVAQPVDSDWHMQYCPLLLPARATFVCVAKK